ncbi:MAG TPA: hypothetical protein VFP25_04635 [Nitrososphaeraceae archaeon]|nr:hypothetical protein [Nitrososphaeraceae archaeon]
MTVQVFSSSGAKVNILQSFPCSSSYSPAPPSFGDSAAKSLCS